MKEQTLSVGRGRNPTGGQVRRKMELLNVNNYLEEKKVAEHLCRVRGSIPGHWDQREAHAPGVTSKVGEAVRLDAPGYHKRDASPGGTVCATATRCGTRARRASRSTTGATSNRAAEASSAVVGLSHWA